MVFREQQYWSLGMPPSVSVEVEQPPNTWAKYQLWYLVNNNIGAEGCRHISHSKWNNLQALNICISYGI